MFSPARYLPSQTAFESHTNSLLTYWVVLQPYRVGAQIVSGTIRVLTIMMMMMNDWRNNALP